MSEVARDACNAALKALSSICGSIVDGSIVMSELELIKENKKAFKKLCAEANIKSFELESWLGQLDSVVQHIGIIQEFCNLLDSSVKGELFVIQLQFIYACIHIYTLII